MLYLVSIPLTIVAAIQPRTVMLTFYLIAIPFAFVAQKRGWGKRAFYPLAVGFGISFILGALSFPGSESISPLLANVLQILVAIVVIIVVIVMMIKSDWS